MIERHNSVVSKDDVCYFLGDFCFTNAWRDVEDILKQMNGTKHLVLGNHDKLYVFDYIEAGFTSVHTSLMLDNFMLIYDPAIAGVNKSMNFIHGHVHSMGLNIAPNCYNVCVETSQYTPVDFEYIKKGVLNEF